jgi:hypothetical protein
MDPPRVRFEVFRRRQIINWIVRRRRLVIVQRVSASESARWSSDHRPNVSVERRAISATPSYSTLSTLPDLLVQSKLVARPVQR